MKKVLNFVLIKIMENRGSFENRTSEIDELKKRIYTANNSLREKEKQLNLLKIKIRQKEHDIRKLVGWIDQINNGVSIVLNSKRWKLGNYIIDYIRKITFKVKNPSIEELLYQIFENYEEWSKYEKTQIDKFEHKQNKQPILHPEIFEKRNLYLINARKNIKKKFFQLIREILNTEKNERFIEQLDESETFIENTLSVLPMPSESPLFSIIMPTFNRAHIIRDSIQSVLDQEYINWELWVCDDGSSDNTEMVVQSFGDSRIKYIKCAKVGGAQARNVGLSHATGAYIAYLDSDNIWHPEFLNIMVRIFNKNKGIFTAYSKHIDLTLKNNTYYLNRFSCAPFDYESLLKFNFIDLNSFVHLRALKTVVGDFNPNLKRLQDYDLILKYCFLRDPHFIRAFLAIYRRNEKWAQISRVRENDRSCVSQIKATIDKYFQYGLPVEAKSPYKSITVLSWDICRNHFSKAYNIAECLSKDFKVQLIGFRFFNSKIFKPYKNESPSFETLYLKGAQFPDFKKAFDRALCNIKGDLIYAVKPRLPSFGLALLANHRLGIPFILEINDMESLVSDPVNRKIDKDFTLSSVDLSNSQLLNPYSDLWSKIMETFALNAPFLVTHNGNIDSYFGSKCFFIRNLKNEEYYNPHNYEKDKIRKEYGFSNDDRVIFFGGMIRKHKGIYQLVDLIKKINDSRYKLVFVSSRVTQDQSELASRYRDVITILPSQGRNEMAKIHMLADLVIIWLDPAIEVSHFQLPYKLTDAFAMKIPVIANDISDFGNFGRNGYLRLVDYKDFDKIINEIQRIFDEPQKTSAMTDRARMLYLRQFSYSAARTNFQIISQLLAERQNGDFEISSNFYDFYKKFYSLLK